MYQLALTYKSSLRLWCTFTNCVGKKLQVSTNQIADAWTIVSFSTPSSMPQEMH
jgi:hypothetical protein